MYVRATRRDAAPAEGGRVAQVRYPFDLIFPVELGGRAEPIRITRGFAVPPGDYDVYVALRERGADPLASEPRLKAAVLKQPLSVPDFWAGELATSSVMLADRIEPLLQAPSRRRCARTAVRHRAERNSSRRRARRSGKNPRTHRRVSHLQRDGVGRQELRHPGGLSPVPDDGEGGRGSRRRTSTGRATIRAARAGERYMTHTAAAALQAGDDGGAFRPRAPATR